MSVQSEIDRIRTNIAGAYSAVSDKGGELPEQRNSENLAEAIRSIAEAADGPLGPVEVYRTARPADWMPLPEPVDDEIWMLVHIPDGLSTPLAFTVTCSGSYTVELGSVDADGVFQSTGSTVLAGGAVYETELSAGRYGGLTGDQMKQAAVRVSGTGITSWSPAVHSKKAAPSGFTSWNIVEMKCRLPKGTAIACGSATVGKSLRRLRFFTWNGPNDVSDMNSMFMNCTALVCVPGLDTSKATDMSHMFNGCASLSAIAPPDTSNVTNMAGMFRGCASLTAVPPLETAKVTDMSYMFYGCSHLTELPPMDMSEVTNIGSMCANCGALVSVSPMNIRKVTAIGSAFSNCTALIRIPLLAAARMTSMSSSFFSCFNLSEFKLDPTVTEWAGCTLSLQNCSLEHKALVDLLNSLPAITADKTLTLTGNPGAEELTEAEQAIAAGKNWTLKL